MSDKIEYPGVYVDESQPGHSIEGVPTTPTGTVWTKLGRVGAAAIVTASVLRLFRRRRRHRSR